VEHDYAFEIATSSIRFGPGATTEVGMDLADHGVKKALVVTDSNMRELPPVNTVLDALSKEGISYAIFDEVRVEPTDESLRKASFLLAVSDSI